MYVNNRIDSNVTPKALELVLAILGAMSALISKCRRVRPTMAPGNQEVTYISLVFNTKGRYVVEVTVKDSVWQLCMSQH